MYEKSQKLNNSSFTYFIYFQVLSLKFKLFLKRIIIYRNFPIFNIKYFYNQFSDITNFFKKKREIERVRSI